MIDMKTYNNTRRVGNSMRTAMKGLLGMACLVMSLCAVSCSDDVIDASTEQAPSNTLSRRAYTDEQMKVQRLGYAYNAAGNVMNDSSFSASPVINMERLQAAESTLGPIISTDRRYYTAMDIFSGNTLEELGHSETKYTIDDSEAVGSGKYYRNNTTFSKTTFHNSYKVHMFIKHIMASMTIDAGLLHCLKVDDLNEADNVLEADFRQKVAELVSKGAGAITEADATAFSEKYGTHLVVSSNLGGMIELQMQINRDSCVEQEYTTVTVSQVILGKNVVKTGPSQNIKTSIPVNTTEYEGQINVKGGRSKDCEMMHRTFDHKSAEAQKLSDGNYYEWATNISIAPESYNAAFVSGRFLPYYELFEDLSIRQVMRQVYKLYMKKEAPTQEIYEPPYGVMPVAKNYGPDVRVAKLGDHKSCIICEEYVPSIRSDKPCIVAYPLIKGEDGNVRPFLYSGLFIGDKEHRPGRVIWKGSASVYTPSDSIFYENDSVPAIKQLFDESTHALKNVYFYWNNVHPQPCPTKTEAPQTYTCEVFCLQPEKSTSLIIDNGSTTYNYVSEKTKVLAEPVTFAKVASYFWSVRPVVLKTDSLRSYWDKDTMFVQFARDRYDGVTYKETESNKYSFCLLDGGDNIKRAKEETNDENGDKRWINAVSNTTKALNLTDKEGNTYLPSVQEAKSITKMLGNRMSVFYSHDFNGRNMLGLDWPTGYWAIAHPKQPTMAKTFEQLDKSGMPIVVNDAGQARILRLSGSGTDLTLEYPEYVKSFNYSDQDFFKFFPIYITIDKF